MEDLDIWKKKTQKIQQHLSKTTDLELLNDQGGKNIHKGGQVLVKKILICRKCQKFAVSIRAVCIQLVELLVLLLMCLCYLLSIIKWHNLKFISSAGGSEQSFYK